MEPLEVTTQREISNLAAVVNEVQNRVDDGLSRVKAEQSEVKAEILDCSESIRTLAQSAKLTESDL